MLSLLMRTSQLRSWHESRDTSILIRRYGNRPDALHHVHETCHSITLYFKNAFSDINRKCILPIMVMSDKTTSDIIRTYIFNLFHSVLKGLTCWLKAIENLSPKLPHYNVSVTLTLIKFCQNQALSTPNWISNILV